MYYALYLKTNARLIIYYKGIEVVANRVDKGSKGTKKVIELSLDIEGSSIKEIEYRLTIVNIKYIYVAVKYLLVLLYIERDSTKGGLGNDACVM